jgi:hypothetical protein
MRALVVYESMYGNTHVIAPAAAFDTRIHGVPAFTGRASRGIGRLLKRHGYRLVAAPESFLVGPQSTLLDGEASRARRWGTALAASGPGRARHALPSQERR